jgi:hypothetical protein
MFRRVAIIAGIGGAALTGGCADIMSQSAVSQIAPDWFAEKAVEVKGEGYPKLSDIPEPRQVTGSKASWDRLAASLKDQAAKLEAKVKADGTVRSDEDVRATAAQWRACVEEGKANCGSPVSPSAPAVPETSGQ